MTMHPDPQDRHTCRAVIAFRDRWSLLYAYRCDPAACPTYRPPKGARWREGDCQVDGCWLGSAFTEAERDARIARQGHTILRRE